MLSANNVHNKIYPKKLEKLIFINKFNTSVVCQPSVAIMEGVQENYEVINLILDLIHDVIFSCNLKVANIVCFY